VKEPAGVAAIGLGRAIGLVRAIQAAEDVVLGGPAHVVADEKIEQAVAVIVKPQCGSAEALMPEKPARTRDVNKCSFTGVSKKPALANAADENVRKAIIIVVADRDAHAVHLDVQACGLGYVRKCSVAIVAIEPQGGALPLVSGPVHSIDEQNVLPAIAVVVEEGAARSQCFRKELAAIASRIVAELNACSRCHIR